MNKKANKFKIGDKVTTNYNGGSADIVRTVTDINRDERHESGYAVCVDGGTPCKKCGKVPDRALDWIDSGWLVKVKK